MKFYICFMEAKYISVLKFDVNVLAKMGDILSQGIN